MGKLTLTSICTARYQEEKKKTPKYNVINVEQKYKYDVTFKFTSIPTCYFSFAVVPVRIREWYTFKG